MPWSVELADSVCILGPMRSDAEVRAELEPLLFGWHHVGLRKAGAAYGMAGFVLVAITIDVLAGLAYDPPNDDDRGRGGRYKRFVQDFFPAQYTRLREEMWDGLRSSPIHYFTTTDVLFADNQPHQALHLTKDTQGRVILHWPDFLRDYEAARDKYWGRLRTDAQLMDKARRRLERRPVMTVLEVERPLLPTVPLPTGFPSPTGMAVASGAMRPASSPQKPKGPRS
jgi:hypothetical protein